MIKKNSKGGYDLYTKNGSRKLGTHSSRASALRQERAIKASESKKVRNNKR